MKDLKDIDIAFLPVNQPYTMTVPQAAKAAKMFSPKILYPYHYGDTKIGKLKDALKGSGIDVRIRELQ
jgi:L-ascorbate metabolism protein UlaG (beta-lactamase superfamily)